MDRSLVFLFPRQNELGHLLVFYKSTCEYTAARYRWEIETNKELTIREDFDLKPVTALKIQGSFASVRPFRVVD